MNLIDCNARRKADRSAIFDAYFRIGQKHGATISCRQKERNPGFCGAGIHMEFARNGVGAMVTIYDLHGGEGGLVSWFNDYSGGRTPCRDFSNAMFAAAGDYKSGKIGRHKATSCGTWAELAERLDRGLALAAAGEAFEPSEPARLAA